MSSINSALPPGSVPNPTNRPSEPTSHDGKVQEVAHDHFNQPEAATTQGSALEELPDELLIHLLTFLDLHELVEFGCTSKSSKELISDPLIWGSIAKRIHCPIDKAADPRTQVLKFIARILQSASAIENRPDEITQILKKPTIDQLNTIQDWLQAREDLPNWKALTDRINLDFPNLNLEGPDEIDNLSVQQLIAKGKDYRQWHIQHLELLKARDILAVWLCLAEDADLQAPNFERSPTEQDIIDKSTEFAVWFDANQEALAGLTALSLSGIQLTSIPTEIGRLTNLQLLVLSYNQLTSIPGELGQLTQLEKLYLHNNKFTSIPDEIWQLTNLQLLGLNSNKLISIPGAIGQLIQLQGLYLGNNQLTLIPGEIGRLINLRNLGLQNNRLTLIPNDIGRLTNLQGLGLGGNKLISIPGEIEQLPNLELLDLCNNKLTTIPETLLQKGIRLYVGGNPVPLSLKARFFVRDNQKSLTITAVALATIYGLYYNREWALGALSFINDHLKF